MLNVRHIVHEFRLEGQQNAYRQERLRIDTERIRRVGATVQVDELAGTWDSDSVAIGITMRVGQSVVNILPRWDFEDDNQETGHKMQPACFDCGQYLDVMVNRLDQTAGMPRIPDFYIKVVFEVEC